MAFMCKHSSYWEGEVGRTLTKLTVSTSQPSVYMTLIAPLPQKLQVSNNRLLPCIVNERNVKMVANTGLPSIGKGSTDIQIMLYGPATIFCCVRWIK